MEYQPHPTSKPFLLPLPPPHIPTSTPSYSHAHSLIFPLPTPLLATPNLPSQGFPCCLFPFSRLVCFSHRRPLSLPTLAFIGFLPLFFFLPFHRPFPSRKKTPGSCRGLDELLTLLGLDFGRNFSRGCAPAPTPGSQISSSWVIWAPSHIPAGRERGIRVEIPGNDEVLGVWK